MMDSLLVIPLFDIYNGHMDIIHLGKNAQNNAIVFCLETIKAYKRFTIRYFQAKKKMIICRHECTIVF